MTMNLANFLQSPECKSIMKGNRTSIHVESGDIRFDNKTSQESIYSFMQAQ